jgi:hypothetical protein
MLLFEPPCVRPSSLLLYSVLYSVSKKLREYFDTFCVSFSSFILQNYLLSCTVRVCYNEDNRATEAWIESEYSLLATATIINANGHRNILIREVS